MAAVSSSVEGQSLSPEDYYSGGRCATCDRLCNWSLWQGEPKMENLENSKFPHVPKASELKRSATSNNCGLCLLFHEALIESQRPEVEKGEPELPDRQVYIEVRTPDLTWSSISLKVTIEPPSLAIAGNHDPDALPDYPCFFGFTCTTFEAGIEAGYAIVDGGDFSRTPVWYLSLLSEDEASADETEPQKKYFFGKEEVSQDEYFAIASPYYVGFVDISSVDPSATMLLRSVRDEPDNSTASQAARVSVMLWRVICMKSHPYCLAAQVAASEGETTPLLPSRVLLIETEWNSRDTDLPSRLQVRLFESPEGARANYVTLSHCWGTNPIIRTTQANIEEHRRGISWDTLPQTFRDALHVALSHNCRFLWIDSLCIVQDSPADWARESGRMGTVYRNASFCISALAAEDASAGCFRTRVAHRPAELWPTAPPALRLRAFAAPSDGGGDSDGNNEAWWPIFAFSRRMEEQSGRLVTRGWVLQEEALSLRRVVFGDDAVSWKCLTTYLTERDPSHLYGEPSRVRDDRFDYVQVFQAGLSGLLDLGNERRDIVRLYQSWGLMVEQFTRRQLTRSSDRLAALAGLATEFSRATGDQYLAGIWTKYLWRELLWHVSSVFAPRFGRPMPKWERLNRHGLVKDFSAPTWSWARMDTEIVYFPRAEVDNYLDHDILVSIDDYECDPPVAETISSAFSGVIKLKGQASEVVASQITESTGYVNLGIQLRGHIETDELEVLKDRSKAGRMSAVAKLNEAMGAKDYTSDVEDGGARPDNDEIERDQAEPSDRPCIVLMDQSEDSDGNQVARVLPTFLDYQERMQSAVFDYTRIRDSEFSQASDAVRIIVDGNWPLDATSYAGNPLRLVESGEQIGYWAPDHETNVVKSFSILFLAISRYRGYIYGLGLEAEDEAQGIYRRIGLGFWHEASWDKHDGKADMDVTLV